MLRNSHKMLIFGMKIIVTFLCKQTTELNFIRITKIVINTKYFEVFLEKQLWKTIIVI